MSIKRIGLLCSGGDAPGMNCAIRAIVRSALFHKIEPIGIQKGFSGLLEGNMRPLKVSSVGNILQKGGTILQTSRCPEFHEKKIRTQAAKILQDHKIDALIVIGGNGSFQGTHLLSKEHGVLVMGIPGTIDNDISGTSDTIGFNSAVQTAVEAVDRIRDTAFSHERTFLVEVMGRSSAAIAQYVGICTGAENVVFPNSPPAVDSIASDIQRGLARGKNSSIIIVAEGKDPRRTYNIQEELLSHFSIESRICILGHIQRGGAPTSHDRYLASRMGHLAVKGLIEGQTCGALVSRDGQIQVVPLTECLEKRTEANESALEMMRTLSI